MPKFSFGPLRVGSSLAVDETQVLDTLTTGVKATSEGISIRIDTPFGTEGSSDAYATGPFPIHGFSEGAWWSRSRTDINASAAVSIINLTPGGSYYIEVAGKEMDPTRDTRYTFPSGFLDYDANDGATDSPNPPVSTTETADVNGEIQITVEKTPTGNFYGYLGVLSVEAAAAVVPVVRKSSTFDIETTLGTITTATLNSVNVADHITGQAGTTVSFGGAATDEIATSGEYTLTLGDGATTENITVQVNVVGLASFNINKDGADQGSLTDVEFIILTGAAGSRAINQQITGITTTAGGDTGTIEITDAALDVDDTITVVQQSPTVGGGAVHTATLELI